MDEIRVGNPGFTPCASNAGNMTIPQNIAPPIRFKPPSIHPAIVALSSSLVKSPTRAAGLIVSSALMMPGSTKDTHMGAVLKNPVGSVNVDRPVAGRVHAQATINVVLTVCGGNIKLLPIRGKEVLYFLKGKRLGNGHVCVKFINSVHGYIPSNKGG